MAYPRRGLTGTWAAEVLNPDVPPRQAASITIPAGSSVRCAWVGVYDGDVEDLGAPAKPSPATRIQDILWNRSVDASPSTHLVAKADAEGLSPETV